MILTIRLLFTVQFNCNASGSIQMNCFELSGWKRDSSNVTISILSVFPGEYVNHCKVPIYWLQFRQCVFILNFLWEFFGRFRSTLKLFMFETIFGWWLFSTIQINLNWFSISLNSRTFLLPLKNQSIYMVFFSLHTNRFRMVKLEQIKNLYQFYFIRLNSFTHMNEKWCEEICFWSWKINVNKVYWSEIIVAIVGLTFDHHFFRTWIYNCDES